MVRILHVVTHMNRGGLETMIMNYYRNIDRSIIQFDFLVHRYARADYDDEIEALGGRIYRIPTLNPFSKHYLRELNKFFLEHKEYKVVHSHLDCLSAIPLKAAKNAGVPYCIAHSHNTNQDHNLKYLIKLYYRRLIPKYADKLFACSADAGDWMFKGYDYDVLPNAIDASKFRYSSVKSRCSKKDFGFSDADFVIGHVGRFSPQKNHRFLIDVFKEIKKRNPGAKLLLVGNGEKQSEIMRKVSNLKLNDSVYFTGVREDIPDLLSAMDVFVFPSLFEGLPVTLIEAQASGLPCFISDKVPIECKKTNLVTQISLEKSPEEWAEIIIRSNWKERKNMYEEICRAGFDIKTNAQKLQHFYISRGELSL